LAVKQGEKMIEILKYFREPLRAALTGELPLDSRDWACVVDNNDTTIAHIVAALCMLPKGFFQWSIARAWSGWTVAHELAAYQKMPEGFDQWDLVSLSGVTVAHVAARWGNLPELDANSPIWNWADDNGETVRECYMRWNNEKRVNRG
jgi:hypothetical protein